MLVRLFSPKFLFVTLVTYWTLMLLGTHVPFPDTGGDSELDKLAHFIGYGGLTVVLTLWSEASGRAWPWWQVAAIVLGYGIFDEVTQPIFGRGCELLDWVMDVVGFVAGWAATRGLLRWAKPFLHRQANDSPVSVS